MNKRLHARLTGRALTGAALDALLLAGNGNGHERFATRAMLTAVFRLGLRRVRLVAGWLAYALVMAATVYVILLESLDLIR